MSARLCVYSVCRWCRRSMRTEKCTQEIKEKDYRHPGVEVEWVELGQLKGQIVFERKAGVRNVQWSKTRRFPSRDYWVYWRTTEENILFQQMLRSKKHVCGCNSLQTHCQACKLCPHNPVCFCFWGGYCVLQIYKENTVLLLFLGLCRRSGTEMDYF